MQPTEIETIARAVSALSAIVSLLVAALALTITVRNRQTEKIRITRDLYQYFFSNDMLKSRDIAWFWIDKLRDTKSMLSFEQMWRDELLCENFAHLHRILAFWHSFYVLYRRGQLNRHLAEQLLGYEYLYWADQLTPLVVKTVSDLRQSRRLEKGGTAQSG
jgi:hypothetical protein